MAEQKSITTKKTQALKEIYHKKYLLLKTQQYNELRDKLS